jgi:hypothetical protein
MTGAKRTILRRERRPTVFSDEALQLFRELDRQPKPDDAAVHRLARLLGLVPQYWTVNSPLDKSSAPVHPHGYQAHSDWVHCRQVRNELLAAIAAQDKQGRG